MLRRLGSFFSYANVVATLALFVAMGGVSYAAVTLADGSVTTRKLAANAVTSPKIKDGQVATSDLALTVRNKLAAPYTKAQSDGRYLPRTGSVAITEPLSGWWAALPASYGTQTQAGFALLDNLTAASTGIGVYRLGLTVPARLQGREVALNSVELCYSAFKPNTTLTRVTLLDATTSGTDVAAAVDKPIEDFTVRDDTSCQVYTPATPVAVDEKHTLTLEVRATFGATGEWLVVNRVTANYAT
jgi:hypothetical protein